MANAQIAVGTTPTLLVAADPHDQTVILHAGNSSTYIGNASVSTTNGYLMDNKDKLTLSLGAYEALYGVVTTGSHVVYVYSVVN